MKIETAPRAELIETYIPGLRRFARALLRDNPEGADDLVQDSLERALSHWQGRYRDRDLRGWLYTILYNRFRSERLRWRQQGPHCEFDAVSEARLPRTKGGQEAALAYRDLLRGFSQLPKEQRAVLFLIAIEDLSYQDAARVLGVPVGTVMSRLSRGRARLRQSMNGVGQPAKES
jgi:RNA polymerase sigma-70 factor (ECF subfamily)